ncbi:MAG: hypothetical protein RXR31_01905 [Thermoproteota archaeon]
MMQYEQVLNKIAPLYYKFVTYSHYFLNKELEIRKFVNFDLDVTRGYSSSKVRYSFITDFDRVNHDWYFIISLKKSNVFMEDELYGFVGFIITMVINKFSFENEKIVENDKPLYLYSPARDLFIKLVGKDLYDAIRISVK